MWSHKYDFSIKILEIIYTLVKILIKQYGDVVSQI